MTDPASIRALEPLSRQTYRRTLAPELDLRPRGRDALVVVHLVAHVAIWLGVGLAVALHDWPLWAMPLFALLSGHSVMVAAFASHELGHGAGRLPRGLRAAFVQLGWLPAIFATPTVQSRAHNQKHHKEENGRFDPDRRLTRGEILAAKGENVVPWIFPSSAHPVSGALFGFAVSVFGYHTSLFAHSVFRTGQLYDVKLSDAQRRRVLAEGALSAATQLGLFAASGFSGAMALYLACTYFVGASLAGAYIATNHLLCGLVPDASRSDVLATTVSLRVPKWVDVLHLHFSHHVEHHLFPGASYRALPQIRRALLRHYPERFVVLTWGDALRRLLRSPIAISDANTLVHADGTGARRVDFAVHDEAEFRGLEPDATRDEALDSHELALEVRS
ncbi:MAG: fatty acid desaturase [Sandaracinus sp.]|nr:fatty acid desaturase [Sandaracinus sp.]